MSDLLSGIVVLLACQVCDPPVAVAANEAPPVSIDVRYARAQVALARANLERVKQMNRRVAGTVSASVIDEFKRDLEKAAAQLKIAEAPAAEDAFTVWLARAESNWQDADAVWQDAVAANRRFPDTYAALDVERFRLRAEVTLLQLERGKALAAGPREAQLAWQLEMLASEIQKLKEDARSGPTLRPARIWWY